MIDIIGIITVLAVPFLLGIAVGVEIVRRRPKSTNEQFGELIKERLLGVYTQRQWVGIGDGIEISSAIEFEVTGGRKLQILVREVC